MLSDKVKSSQKKNRAIIFILIIIGLSAWGYGYKLDRGEKIVESKARSIIIDKYGEDYFYRYFELWNIQRNGDTGNWAISVTYFYNIDVANYSTQEEVYFKFDSMLNFVSANRLPEEDNMMPFTISREQAISVALNQVTREYVEYDAEIYFRNKIEGTSINKYLWTIIFYHSPKNMSSGESTVVYVDPVSGIIEVIEESGWATAY
ncbi:MAG: hypothetical protein V1710_00790 [Candidatus Bathyarchaeota archaeon]